MGLYFKDILQNDVEVLKLTLNAFDKFDIHFDSIELWDGYPLDGLGKLIKKLNNHDFKDFHEKGNVMIVNGRYELLNKDQKQLELDVSFLEISIFINLNGIMKDMAHFEWNIIYPFEGSEKKIMDLPIFKSIYEYVWDHMDISLGTIGITNDSLNPNYEIPIRYGFETKKSGINPFVNHVMPKLLTKYNELTIKLPNLYTKFFTSVNELFYQIAHNIASKHTGINLFKGSIILDFEQASDWDKFKNEFDNVLQTLNDVLPKEETIFNKWEAILKKKYL